MCNKRRFVCIFKVNFKTLISFTFAFLTTAAHVDPLPHLFGVFIYLCIYLFIYLLFLNLFMAVLGLHFCVRAFSSCSKRGPLFITVRGPLSRPLLLRSTGSGRAGSVVVAYGPSCSAAFGIFPDQGSNLCPLHWQADSQPLRHQGSFGTIIDI